MTSLLHLVARAARKGLTPSEGVELARLWELETATRGAVRPPAAPEQPSMADDMPEEARGPVAGVQRFDADEPELTAEEEIRSVVEDCRTLTPDALTDAVLPVVRQRIERLLDYAADLEEKVIAMSQHQEHAERAEAAIARVRHLATLIAAGAPWLSNHRNTANRIHAALDTPAPADTA